MSIGSDSHIGTFNMDGEFRETLEVEKDIFVTISSNLRTAAHTTPVRAFARAMLAAIRRSFSNLTAKAFNTRKSPQCSNSSGDQHEKPYELRIVWWPWISPAEVPQKTRWSHQYTTDTTRGHEWRTCYVFRILKGQMSGTPSYNRETILREPSLQVQTL